MFPTCQFRTVKLVSLIHVLLQAPTEEQRQELSLDQTQTVSSTGTNAIWIKGPIWDLLWILSGPAVATFLYFMIAEPTLLKWVAIPSHLLHAPTVSLGVMLIMVILLQLGHVLSPITAAWGHPGYRRIARAQWVWHMLIPLTIIAATTSIGWFAGHDLLRYATNEESVLLALRSGAWRHPFVAVFIIYLSWNAWHFSMQDFGVLQIYRRRGGALVPRWCDRLFCLMIMGCVIIIGFMPLISFVPGWWTLRLPSRIGFGITATILAAVAAMLWRKQSLPRRLFIFNLSLAPLLSIWWPIIVLRLNSTIWLLHLGNYRLPDMTNPIRGMIDQGFWIFGIVAINHWLVAIGLSSYVLSRRWCYAMAIFICGLGVALYFTLFFSPTAGLIVATTTAIGLRRGFDFTHFMYDRRLWQLRNPLVRETIGEDLGR